MDFDHARSTVLNFLKASGRAKNSDMIGLLGGDRAMFERVREDLIFNDLAAYKDSVGLISLERRAETTPDPTAAPGQVRVFLSYGRRDAAALVDRLYGDLSAAGFSVWRDTLEIKAGLAWQQQIAEGLRDANVVVAILSPHSVRTTLAPDSPDNVDSVCLAEISYALYVAPPRPLVPVMAQTCEPPLPIFHLHFIDMRDSPQSDALYWQKLGELIDSIHAALRGDKKYRSWYSTLNPFNFSAFLHERRRDFTGRQSFLQRLDTWRRQDGRERALLVTGDPGSGKSALVAELVYRNPDGQVLAYHCCQWDRLDTLSASRMVRSLAAMAASKLDEYAAMLRAPEIEQALEESNCRRDPASAFEDGLLGPLQRLTPPEGGARYILIDALDESLDVPRGEPSIVDVLATRLNRLPGWLRLVATSRNDLAVLDRLQGLRAERLETYSSENESDLAEFVAGRLDSDELKARLEPLKLSSSAVAGKIIDRSEGNFLYAQQALDGIERNLIDARTLDSLPPGLSGLYQNRLLHQFPDATSFAQARIMLEIATAAQEPLAESILAAASGLGGDDFGATLRKLSAYLPMRLGQDGTERFAIYHKSLADWLTDPRRRGSVHFIDARQGHERLAMELWRAFRTGVENLPPYGLAHLAVHLIELQRWSDLTRLLTDISYLEARNRVGQAFDLARDLTRSWQALPASDPMKSTLQLIDEAFRRDIQFVHAHREDYPQALFQSLWNYAWWYDGRASAGASPKNPGASPCSSGGFLSRLFGKPQAAGKPVAETAPVEGGPLSRRLELMRADARRVDGRRPWLRALSPPADSLGSSQKLLLRGHKAPVVGVWFLPGEQLISASNDGVVRHWDAVTGMLLTSFAFVSPVDGLDFVTMGMAFAPAVGQFARAAWVQKEFRRQHSETMEWETFELRDPSIAGNYITLAMSDGSHLLQMHGGDARVMALAWCADGGNLALGHADGAVLVFNAGASVEMLGRFDTSKPVASTTRVSGSPADRGKIEDTDPAERAKRTRFLEQVDAAVMFERPGEDAAVCSVAVSRDGASVACGTWSDAIHVFDIKSGAESYRFYGHLNHARALAFSPDGSRLASASDDYDIRIWDLEAARTATTLAHRDRVGALVFSSDGKRILSGSNDMLARLWDVQSGQELQVLSGHAAAVSTVALSPDSRFAASGSADRTVRVWDLQSRLLSRRSPSHSAMITSIAFAPSGDWLASASEDSTIRIWDAASGEELRVLNGHTARVSSIAITPDGASLASSSSDGTIRIWDVASGGQKFVLQCETPNVFNVAFVANGHRVICADGARLQLWDAVRGAKLSNVPESGTHRTAHAFTPNGAIAAVATDEPAELKMWDREQQREVVYKIRDQSIAGSLVRVYDLPTGRERLRLRAHSQAVRSIALHPGGGQMVTSSSDQGIIWNLESGEPIGRLWGVTGDLDRLAYSATGAHIVGGQQKSDTVWTWPSAGGAPLATISGFGRLDAIVAWKLDPNAAQAYVENDETVVQLGHAGADTVRFPAALTALTRHPIRPVWAGARGRHIQFVMLDTIKGE